MEIDFSIKDVEKNKDTFSVHFTVLKIIKEKKLHLNHYTMGRVCAIQLFVDLYLCFLQ
jgi:hypothetical protein